MYQPKVSASNLVQMYRPKVSTSNRGKRTSRKSEQVIGANVPAESQNDLSVRMYQPKVSANNLVQMYRPKVSTSNRCKRTSKEAISPLALSFA